MSDSTSGSSALRTVTSWRASTLLACLRDCGLLEARSDWRHVYFRLADSTAQLLDANDAFIARVADRIAACPRPERPRAAP